MKKYFSLASALMLALGMGMTSCSNDLDEVQAPAEQQPEMHKLHLKATAPNSAETRAFIEGVAGYEDAFTITGWKNGDKLYGIYQIVTEDMGDMKEGVPGIVEFTFNGSTNEFESEETSVTNDKIAYFIHGEGALGGGTMRLDYQDGDWYSSFRFVPTNFAQTVDVDNHFTGIMMSGEASVDGEDNLTTNMQLPNNLAFICLHNDSESPITAKLIDTNNYITESYMGMSGSRQYNVNRNADSNKALIAQIPAHGKAYLPVMKSSSTYKVEVNGNEIAEKTGGIVAGKVYKLTYPSSKFVAK